MNQDAINALRECLVQIFTPESLRAWLPNIPDGDRISSNLPGGTVTPAQYFFSAVDILRRWGLLGVPEFWDPLEKEAPSGLRKQVADLRIKFGVRPGNPSAIATTSPETSSSSKFTVLLVSANPAETVRLRTDREFRDVTAKMRTTVLRDRFNFIQIQAARFDDLRSALLLYKPHVLHISSHGEDDGSLRFESDDGGDGVVSKAKLLRLLKVLRDNLRIVVVNACYSLAVTRDIAPTIDLAIGMSNEVQDLDAIKFATAFYEALGYGRTVESAFELATIDLDEEVQQLFPPADKDPDRKRQLVLVTP